MAKPIITSEVFGITSLLLAKQNSFGRQDLIVLFIHCSFAYRSKGCMADRGTSRKLRSAQIHLSKLEDSLTPDLI